MASRLLDRLKRSLFKDGGQGAEPEQPGGGPDAEEFTEVQWEAELEEEEEECVTERLGGTLCFDGGVDGGRWGEEGGGEGEGSGGDSDSDFLGESMEETLGSTDTSPGGVSPVGSSSLLSRQLQESWRSLRGGIRTASSSKLQLDGPAPSCKSDSLLFEVTDASVVQDGSSKYVLYTILVIQSGGSDKTPAVITRRYSDFQKLHATLRRHHGDQMERVCFPRKKMHRNFTAETIAKRSRAFEQYLSHLCSLTALRGALSVRRFFYLPDIQTGQLLIRVGRYQEALGPLLNAKRLQHKLGWASHHGNQAYRHGDHGQAMPPATSHWLFTVVALSCSFQEVEQLQEAQEHCDHALRVLTPPSAAPRPTEVDNQAEDKPLPLEDESLPLEDKPHPLNDNPPPLTDTSPHLDIGRPHPLLLALLRAMVRLSWQTGRDKRQWEDLLQHVEERWAGLDNQPTIKEFLVKHDLQGTEGEG